MQNLKLADGRNFYTSYNEAIDLYLERRYNMVTLCIVCLLLLALAALGLILWGFAYVLWPVLVVLGIGMLIDILVIRSIFKRR